MANTTLLPEIDRRACVSSKEVAERLGITPRTVQSYGRKGLIPGAFQVGAKWLFKRDELEAWFKKQGSKPLI